MSTRTANGLPPALDDACRSLYVGNLDPRVTEVMLREIFASLGEVTHAKIIPDKNNQHGGLNYGFIDMVDHSTASAAIETLNGRKVLGYEIKVNWAYQGNNATREDTSNHHHVFVGDLSPDVTDQVLNKAFSAFGSLSDARVMWDMNTGKSRGYGFLAFRDRDDAERAISTMNGEWLGSRAIRVNWANQKNQTNQADQQPRSGAPTATDDFSPGYNSVPQQPSLSYDVVVNQSPYTNVTVYVGNLAPSVREADLFPLFQLYGYVHEVRLQHDRGFSFIKMDTHEHATMSICYLNGHILHGRALKVSWGKDKNAGDQAGSGYAGGSTGYGDSGVGGQHGAPYAAAAPPQPVGMLVDPATLPPLSDPIAAAAAAAAQAAVIYQLQVQSQTGVVSQAGASAAASNPAAYANDYYAYYAAYYGQAAPGAHAASS